MLASIAILIVAILIALNEVPQLWKKKMLKELSIFSILLMIGTSLSMALAFGVELPNPVDWIEKVMKPVSDWLERLLK